MDRLDLLINEAVRTGFTMDYLEALTSGLDNQAALRVIGNVSELPRYMKSNDNPYVSRSASAPSSESR